MYCSPDSSKFFGTPCIAVSKNVATFSGEAETVAALFDQTNINSRAVRASGYISYLNKNLNSITKYIKCIFTM